MTSIKQFIQVEVLLPRLKKAGVLVVYDPDQRYRELCLEMAEDHRVVIDTTESSIESREAALVNLQLLSVPGANLEGMLVYVPASAPMTNEDKQLDPFAIYGVCGAVFPGGDGDEYSSLCLTAKADHATEIRRIFDDNPNPTFEVIDAVGGGSGWPTLQALLGRESARDILFALMAPDDGQTTALKSGSDWVPEAKSLLDSALGLKLRTRGKSWPVIADELWHFVLFSEFVFDLPGELPGELASVPKAQDVAAPLVQDLCARIRDSGANKARYIDRAEAIEKDLGLATICKNIEDLGIRDTFPFEERSFFSQAVDALKRDNVDRLREVLGQHADSIWIDRGENQAQWQLLRAAVSLVEACADADRQLTDHNTNLEVLIDYYIAILREVDRRHREFEQAAEGLLIKKDGVEEAVPHARAVYRKLVDKVQTLFIRHLESSGWPPTGRLANADVFDKLIEPKLQENGRRVAVLQIDALRYELGVELEQLLTDSGRVQIQPAYAQLPSVTPVGMASLLPGAGSDLKLIRKDDKMSVVLGDQVLTQVAQRMGVLRNRYGQRFTEMSLTDFVRNAPKVPSAVELLVLRSNDMDGEFEADIDRGLRGVARTLQSVIAAIHRLRGIGFQDVVIVTDHGFLLNTSAGPGDTCGKPPGDWITIHERLLLGDGSSDGANFVMPAQSLGIRGDFTQVAGPRSLVSYRSGERYFHGGVSLQETVVPVITLILQPAEKESGGQPTVSISYKGGAKKITTRMPVVRVSAGSEQLFASAIEVLLLAEDRNGEVVGEVKTGGSVNPATGTLSIRPGDDVGVTLAMQLDFEGKFRIKALEPNTLTTFCQIDLETDYTV